MADDAKVVHKVHPSVYQAAVTGNVSNSPFLKDKVDEKANSRLENTESNEEQSNNLDKPRHSHRANPESVYVLDEAKLAEKGIDFWENQRSHSRVNTEWWLQQLRMRQMIKQQQGKGGDGSISASAQAFAYQNQRNPSSAFNIYSNKTSAPGTTRIHKSVRFDSNAGGSGGDDDDDDDEVEESVIEPSVIYHDNQATELSAPADDHKLDEETAVQMGLFLDQDLNDEFEALLRDYRDASAKLLQAEKEKQETVAVLNEQKDTITAQNTKIDELQRQLNVFDSTLKEMQNKSNATQQMVGQLEENLAATQTENVTRVNITKQITESVHEQLVKQRQVTTVESGDDEKSKQMEAELEMLKSKLREKEVIESELRERLNHNENRTGDQLSRLNEKLQGMQHENENLAKSVNDLKYELELQRERMKDADDVKQSTAETETGGYDQETEDVNEPLLRQRRSSANKKERTPRKDMTKQYVGLPPKEYFMQRGWCCGFVCCDSAVGCGSY